MVNLTDVQSSNKQIATSLPPGTVAVFVGATNGIGELAMKAFVKHAIQPRVYFVGRSQEAGNRIKDECRELNADGEYIFIAADVSLIKKVDEVCSQIKAKETAISLLFQSQGTLDFCSGKCLSRYLAIIKWTDPNINRRNFRGSPASNCAHTLFPNSIHCQPPTTPPAGHNPASSGLCLRRDKGRRR